MVMLMVILYELIYILIIDGQSVILILCNFHVDDEDKTSITTVSSEEPHIIEIIDKNDGGEEDDTNDIMIDELWNTLNCPFTFPDSW